MNEIDVYFSELNYDISNAKTRKALKVFNRRAKRLYKNLISNAMTQSVKVYIGRQYKNSINLIKKMNNVIQI